MFPRGEPIASGLRKIHLSDRQVSQVKFRVVSSMFALNPQIRSVLISVWFEQVCCGTTLQSYFVNLEYESILLSDINALPTSVHIALMENSYCFNCVYRNVTSGIPKQYTARIRKLPARVLNTVVQFILLLIW
jgi:hypothetical protein